MRTGFNEQDTAFVLTAENPQSHMKECRSEFILDDVNKKTPVVNASASAQESNSLPPGTSKSNVKLTAAAFSFVLNLTYTQLYSHIVSSTQCIILRRHSFLNRNNLLSLEEVLLCISPFKYFQCCMYVLRF